MAIVLRDTVGDAVGAAGGKIAAEIRGVGWTLYKVSLPPAKSAKDLLPAASRIRRELGAQSVSVADDVYHVQLTITF